MDALKLEIARKRKQIEQLQTGGKKFFKRSDLNETENVEQKKTNEIEHNDKKKTSVGDNFLDDINEKNLLPRSEVIEKLRDRGQPILLFGESELDAFKRLRHLEIYEPELLPGLRNDFQEALEDVDKVYLNEMLRTDQDSSKTEAEQADAKDNDKYMSYDQIQEEAKKIARVHNHEMETKIIIHFLHLLLKLWYEQLNSRSAEEKMSTKGKIAFATYKQTQLYLNPLLRKLKKNVLSEDIFESLVDIIKHLLNKNYIEACSSYLQMAIGNAPWPIGVTMVGIHARTGREKIFSKNVAHVLNDETQRKYIQALKRLMTKCQEFYPTDPSRCVEFQPK